MNDLPAHGRVHCMKCFGSDATIDFDVTTRSEGNWRITANPLAWGNDCPEIIVLGFSKGPTQAGALASTAHNAIAYKGSLGNVGKILDHIGLLDALSGEGDAAAVDRLISDDQGRFHFGSLIRCTVEQNVNGVWKGSGGGMLDKFVAQPFGQLVASNCTSRFLRDLPARTKLVVMFGMGSMRNYVRASFDLFQTARGGDWKWINDVAYTDGSLTVVHVEHFASQGALIPQWLGEDPHPRAIFGEMAISAVDTALGSTQAKVAAGTDRVPLPAKPRLATSSSEARVKAPRLVKEPLVGNDDVATILGAIKSAGYTQVHENKKLAEFISPLGRTIYFEKTRARLNSIKLMVHPNLEREKLLRLSGIEAVSTSHRFHSNMPKFPKMRHRGLDENTFGWQVTSTLLGLPSALLGLQ